MNDASSVSVTFIPSETEIANALGWLSWRACRRPAIIFLFALLPSLIAGVLVPRALWLLPLWLTVVTIIVIFFGAFILLVNARIKRQAKKQFKAAQTSGPTTYTFSDDG